MTAEIAYVRLQIFHSHPQSFAIVFIVSLYGLVVVRSDQSTVYTVYNPKSMF